MRTVLWILIVIVLVGCNDETPNIAKSPAEASPAKTAVKEEEPAEPQPPAYKNEEVAGLYVQQLTEGEIQTAKNKGMDPTGLSLTLNLKADGTFEMGSVNSKDIAGQGTYRVDGRDVILTTEAKEGEPARESPRIRVVEPGKSIEFTSKATGKSMRFVKQG